MNHPRDRPLAIGLFCAQPRVWSTIPVTTADSRTRLFRRDREMAQLLPLAQRTAWHTLQAHYATIKDVHLRELFAQDAGRGERLACEAVGLYLDYSKNRITGETLGLLVNLANECRLRDRIDAMFSGQKINVTEGRAVLHTALRAPQRCAYLRRRPGCRARGSRSAG